MRIIGLLMIIASGMLWAWMLGAFSFFAELAPLSDNIAFWCHPGIQPLFACIAIVNGIAGVMSLAGIDLLAALS